MNTPNLGKICENLYVAQLITTRQRCIYDDDPRMFLTTVFPIGVVDINYVKTGMQGFRLMEETAAPCFNLFYEAGETCTSLTYKLSRKPTFRLFKEQYQFSFEDGILVASKWFE